MNDDKCKTVERLTVKMQAGITTFLFKITFPDSIFQSFVLKIPQYSIYASRCFDSNMKRKHAHLFCSVFAS